MEELNVEIKDFHGSEVRIRYLGMGLFKKIDICDAKGNILYYLQKDISPMQSSQDFKISRREYFNGEEKPTRIYKGWRNSFIEFCCFVAKFKKMPTQCSVTLPGYLFTGQDSDTNFIASVERRRRGLACDPSRSM